VVERMKTAQGREGPEGELVTSQIVIGLSLMDPASGVDPGLVAEWLKERTKAEPDGQGTILCSAMLAERQGKPSEAIEPHYGRIANAGPSWWSYELGAYGMAIAHARLGRVDEAREWLTRADVAEKAKQNRLLVGQETPQTSPGLFLGAKVRRTEALAAIADAESKYKKP
jgi:hypothetical protein